MESGSQVFDSTPVVEEGGTQETEAAQEMEDVSKENGLRPSDSQVYEPSGSGVDYEGEEATQEVAGDEEGQRMEEALVKLSDSQVYDGSLPEYGTMLEMEEPEEPVTFEDIFGTDFDETQFETRANITRGEILRIDGETKNIVQRIEEEEHIANELAKAFGQDADLQQLLDLNTPRDLINTEVVHNVGILSAPDGIKMNPFASTNKFMPTATTSLGNMPVLDNFQCLHLPLSERRISVSDKWDIPEDRRPIQAGLQGAGQTLPGALFSPHNVIRWKKKRGTSSSNARLLTYDNGDRVLRVGTDFFLVDSADASHENLHLMGHHGDVLLQYLKLRKRWRIRPLRKVHNMINSTVEEKERKEREDTMPTVPLKEVKPYVPGRTSSSAREEGYEALYKEFEEGAALYNRAHTARGHELREDADGQILLDDDNDLGVADIESVAASDAASDAGKRALAAQEGDLEVVRESKKSRTA
eukprot:TRINITY_DN24917_c0_g1_i2.p1 TRINITY_DN24917_c0_g1~~TRINITY_DN24917_c0_g1_i2.p1  ORF type:complete len:472 (+),score=153.84 TRINITY_DN24917_c0_g1_i2:43-1458(+)